MFQGCKSLFIKKPEDVSRVTDHTLEMPTLGIFDHSLKFREFQSDLISWDEYLGVQQFRIDEEYGKPEQVEKMVTELAQLIQE